MTQASFKRSEYQIKYSSSFKTIRLSHDWLLQEMAKRLDLNIQKALYMCLIDSGDGGVVSNSIHFHKLYLLCF